MELHIAKKQAVKLAFGCEGGHRRRWRHGHGAYRSNWFQGLEERGGEVSQSQSQWHGIASGPADLQTVFDPKAFGHVALLWYNMFMTITDLINYYLSVPRGTCRGAC
jgi:hypothetical protein